MDSHDAQQVADGRGTGGEPTGRSGIDPHPGDPRPDAADGDGGSGEPPPADGGDEGDDQKRTRSFFAELPVLILIAFVLALLLKTFLVQAFYIPSESMLPTLAVGDRVLVNKVAHELREPERGEVVVFTHEDGGPAAPGDGILERLRDTITSGFGVVPEGETDFIKRIVGLPGETIEMRGGVVYVDDVAIPEGSEDDGGYLSRPDTVDFGPVDIPDDEYFMMGDNRPNSSDSRALLDTVHKDNVVGRAFVIVWPGSRLSGLPIPTYGETGDSESAAVSRAAPGGPDAP